MLKVKKELKVKDTFSLESSLSKRKFFKSIIRLFLSMAKRIGRFRRKTRHKLRKSIKERGKISISNYLYEFKLGDKVVLKAEPAVQSGMYFPRFHGIIGVVAGKQGNCFKILIKDINKEKTIIVHPIHLKQWQA